MVALWAAAPYAKQGVRLSPGDVLPTLRREEPDTDREAELQALRWKAWALSVGGKVI